MAAHLHLAIGWLLRSNRVLRRHRRPPGRAGPVCEPWFPASVRTAVSWWQGLPYGVLQSVRA